MAKIKSLTIQQLITWYMDYVLEHNEDPQSIYKFCKQHHISESEFYDYFTSFETEKMVEVYKTGMSNYSANLKKNSEQLTTWAKSYDYLVMAKNYMNLYDRL